MRRAIPVKTRRLTKAEAARLGISHKAKQRVAANVKRVTRSTPKYSDREVANFVLSAKRGVHTTKERETKFKFSRFKKKSGGETIEFKDLSKAQLFKKLKKYKDKPVRFKFGGGGPAGGAGGGHAKYEDKDIGDDDWYTSQEYDAQQALDHWDDVLADSEVEDVENFGLMVFL